MSRGRKRTPTDDELRLWQIVAESVAPLPRRRRPAATEKAAAPPPAPAPATKPAAPAPPPPPPRAAKAERPAPPKPPALSPIDRRTRTRLTRGAITIDARIDLHGMTQASAERRLMRFLADAQDDGARVVLVITGKGRTASDGTGGERGVLRRVVPMWLSSPALRGIVVGFDEAAPPHGGAGALYVRIRRLRDR